MKATAWIRIDVDDDGEAELSSDIDTGALTTEQIGHLVGALGAEFSQMIATAAEQFERNFGRPHALAFLAAVSEASRRDVGTGEMESVMRRVP